jgi:hypothetical protein
MPRNRRPSAVDSPTRGIVIVIASRLIRTHDRYRPGCDGIDMPPPLAKNLRLKDAEIP